MKKISAANIFLLIVCAALFSAACSRETPPVFILREDSVSSGEKAAEQAEVFFREKTGGAPGKIEINKDGSASVFEMDGGEIIRFCWFSPGGWIAFIPAGFYTLPSGSVSDAAAKIVVKTKNEQFQLGQFAAFFFRPDIVETFIRDGDADMPFTVSSLLAETKRPPLITPPALDGNSVFLNVKSGDEGGSLAFWGRAENGAPAELLKLVNIEEAAQKKYIENDFIFYEIKTELPEISGFPFTGFSVFNNEKTMESERLFFEKIENNISARKQRVQVQAEDARPVLRVVFAGTFVEDMADLFTAQEQGGLYSGVKIYRAETQTEKNFFGLIDEAIAETEEDDTFVCFMGAPLSSDEMSADRMSADKMSADEMGDYLFFAGEETAAARKIRSWELAEKFLSLKTRRSFLLVDAAGMSPAAEETAFARLGQLLGLRTAAANYGSAAASVSAWGGGAGIEGEAEALALPASPSNGRWLGAGDFVSFIQEKFPPLSKKLKIISGADFPFLDTRSGHGEIKMQTMFSGLVRISSLEEAPSVLTFGETLRRTVPAGSYSVTMTYRNGHRETKTTEVGYNTSKWVIFNYTPELLEGDFSRLPAFGVNISELNPGNYKEADPAVLKAMEVPAWRISFLAGEELYRAGNYDRAIAEYTNAIALKNDYTASYVSRGNAYRKKGDSARAVEDYTRALSLKPDYAELYNYRGYLYGQAGDMARAVADYTQAIKYRRDYADALFNRAYAYGKRENWDAAIEDYTRVLELEPRNASAYRERGRARQNKGEAEKAEADFETAENISGR